MTDKETGSGKKADLRKKAEEIAREKADKSREIPAAMSPKELRQTIHELRIHQVELDMQSEELRRIQAKLDAANKRYFDLYDLAPVGYVTVSEKGLILEDNLMAANLLGVTRKSLVGQQLTRYISKDDQDIYYRHRKRLLETDESQSFDLRMVKKDGTVFWGHLDVAVQYHLTSEAQAGTSELRIAMTDITERKRAEEALRSSEERYRNIIDTIPDAYFESDLAGNNIFVNDQFLVNSGYTKEDVQGFNFSKHMDSQSAAQSRKIFNEVYRTGKPAMHVQLELLDKTGKRKIFESSISLMRDSQGQPFGFRGIARDITEKQKQDVLSFHSQKLESVGQLAAGIAHEINTPIQFIGDNITFMKDAFQDILSLTSILNTFKNDGLSNPAVAREFLSKIKEKEEEIDLDFLKKEIPQAIEQSLGGLQRVSTIVLAMREFSHPGGEEMSVLDINKAIESTIILTKNEWKYSADLTTSLAPDLPIVRGFPADFNQVILNIIVNAAQELQEKVEKGGSKKERIEISTRHDGNEVEICIRDTGPGIPPEIQSRIFDPFFTTKAVGKGTGQGLAIAQNIIVHKHGGKIFFETKVGEGTAFYIRLPLDKRRI